MTDKKIMATIQEDYGGGGGTDYCASGGAGGSSFISSSKAAVIINAQGVNTGCGAASITYMGCVCGGNCCSAGSYLVNNDCTPCTAGA